MKAINIAKLRKFLGIKQMDFANRIGISQPYLSELELNKKPLGNDLFEIIINCFGKEIVSDFIYDTTDSINISGTNYGISVGDNNRSSYNNSNNIGNNYNFTLPEKGNVKIIEPDGKTTIHSQGSVYIDDKNEREKELLKQIEELEKRLIERDATIKSKDETINMLKDMLLHRQ